MINKCDDGTHNLRLDVTTLQTAYPNIIDVVLTSCEPTEFAHQSITALRRLIAETLATDPRLAHVRNPIPEPWLRVKTAVGDLAREQSLLESQAFVGLCNQGRAPDRISDVDEQRSLLRLLNDLGVVVAHGLARDAPAALREVTLLDPNWLTGAVYALLNQPQVLRQGGEFAREDLALWLDPDRYPPERYEYILDMMQSADLGLCFRLPTTADEERYLLPEALPSSAPDYPWPDESLRFRYEYGYLPPGMIPRFIVHAHRNLTTSPTRWRTGVVLDVEGCRVLVKGDRELRRVDIAVTGPANRRRSALSVVRQYLAYVHELNPEADPTAQVPLPDDPDKSVGYSWLIDLEEREGGDFSFYPPGEANRRYTVTELLAGVRLDPRTMSTIDGVEPPVKSRPSPAPPEAPPYTPRQAMHLGVFMLGALIILVFIVFGVYSIAGTAAAAAAVIASALTGVLAITALMLRSSGRLSEEGLKEVLNRVRPSEER